MRSRRNSLIRILQDAYSGELAAALAYRGHWKSLNSETERKTVMAIENDEWAHRQRVGYMLEQLGATPRAVSEIRMRAVGRVLGLACHLTGWFLPMYSAGKLESKNVAEYKDAARYARELGLTEFESELLAMARIEKDHETFFLAAVRDHPLSRLYVKPRIEDLIDTEPSASAPPGPDSNCAARQTSIRIEPC